MNLKRFKGTVHLKVILNSPKKISFVKKHFFMAELDLPSRKRQKIKFLRKCKILKNINFKLFVIAQVHILTYSLYEAIVMALD